MICATRFVALLLGVSVPAAAAVAVAADPVRPVDFEAVRLAIEDLCETFPQQYPRGGEYLRRWDAYEKRLPEILQGLADGDEAAQREAKQIADFRRKVLLANPLLDFDRMLVIRRKPIGDPRREKGGDKGLGQFLGLPRQSSWQQDEIPNIETWENDIAILSGLRTQPTLTTFYRQPGPGLVSDLELHYDARKMLFAMPDERRNWQVFEMDLQTRTPRQLTPGDQPGIHNFDPCYLPNGKIVFVSTAPLQGVPCNATVNVAMSYLMDGDGANIRQLCFDQDHNYCPTVMGDGRILYLRWEYTDIPHVWGRYLFTMNPDGTSKREFYGSGGYWPNGIFYARPIPNHPTKFVGIVTGHHVGRVGELVLFDPARGRNAVEGVVQRIPDRAGKVEPLIEDRLTQDSWPKFLHPFPLSENYFIVSANTPISIQPLDEEGAALQLMRSWTTAMPGEVASCVGCHEKQNSVPPSQDTLAAKRAPSRIEPWHGPVRGFSFALDVQPVLDKYCVCCHDGSRREDGQTIPDLRGDQGTFVALKGGNPEPHFITGGSPEELVKQNGHLVPKLCLATHFPEAPLPKRTKQGFYSAPPTRSRQLGSRARNRLAMEPVALPCSRCLRSGASRKRVPKQSLGTRRIGPDQNPSGQALTT